MFLLAVADKIIEENNMDFYVPDSGLETKLRLAGLRWR
jgi:hypothetical protein